MISVVNKRLNLKKNRIYKNVNNSSCDHKILFYSYYICTLSTCAYYDKHTTAYCTT